MSENVKYINIFGARTHNLKNINLELPKNKLIVFTGVSGSGKTSCAFDTIYAEGQRRYVESLSSYSRQFLKILPKPDCDRIDGLSPAIAINQRVTSANPRSTIATMTEIYDYLRLLFARVGTPYSPATGLPIEALTVTKIVDKILTEFSGKRIIILSPIITLRKGEHLKEIQNIRKQGFQRIRLDGKIYDLDDLPKVDPKTKHSIEVVVDRIEVKQDILQRVTESIETALRLSESKVYIQNYETEEITKYSTKFACPYSDFSIDEIEPRLFSFNNPMGACPNCNGLGIKYFFDKDLIVPDKELSLIDGAIRPWDNYDRDILRNVFDPLCKHYRQSITTPFNQLSQEFQEAIFNGCSALKFPGVINYLQKRLEKADNEIIYFELGRYRRTVVCNVCNGDRLNAQALSIRISGKNISDVTKLSIAEFLDWTVLAENSMNITEKTISEKIIHEVSTRAKFLIDVGLSYLHLNRTSGTLSGGESQRIRLASQIGSGLTGVLYVLDEPSIGLHQRDNEKLLNTLFRLRDLDNTVIVVEHDADTILNADYVVDFGPLAGTLGGEVVFAGTVPELLKCPNSLTGRYLNGSHTLYVDKKPRTRTDYITINNATTNNLKNLNVKIPLGKFVCITGVSGCGKSSLIIDTLYNRLDAYFNKKQTNIDISNIEAIKRVIEIDQSPIGRTPKSNPVTYIGGFTPIREFFAALPESMARGYKIGRFSFNTTGGRCEHCKGDGYIKVQMHFLPDVFVECDQCNGKRYDRATLEVKYKGKSISDVLEMTVDEACNFFENIPAIYKKINMLQRVGLGYIKLGQSATTLSGGESQRVKLSKELSKRSDGNTIYILDEPSTGLHFDDIKKLLNILHLFVDQGNTVIVIEHNLDIIKTADWIIDLGPEGGNNGGEIVFEGTPQEIINCDKSYTAKFLRPYIDLRNVKEKAG